MINYFIKEPDNNNGYIYSDDSLGPLSQINLLVGANNSGKSRFLRSILQKNILISTSSQESMTKYLNNLEIEIIKLFQSHFKLPVHNLVSGKISYDYCNILESLKKISSESDHTRKIIGIIKFLRHIKSLPANSQRTLIRHTNAYMSETEIIAPNPQVEQELKHLSYNAIIKLFEAQFETYKAIYFPILRGLRTYNTENDFFKNKIIDDYFSTLDDNTLIYTGLSYYSDIQQLLLGNLSDRKIIHKLEIFLGENFFDGQEIALIPKISDKTLHIKIGAEHERPIHELGDGIQTLILLTLPLLQHTNNKLIVCIEEPELFLHPGMQRKLLEVFSTFTNIQFFITTHSNHLLDVALEKNNISVLTFSKSLPEEGGDERNPIISVQQVFGNDSSPLNLLGVRNSSIFLANCTIWVEGITDRLYFQKYLEILKKKSHLSNHLQEDLHYSFIEYGGGNIVHFNFSELSESDKINVDKICGKSFVIADFDGGKKSKRHDELKNHLGERAYILPVRETENLLTPTVIKKVISEYEKIPFEELQFKKSFKQETYASLYLGRFINNNLVTKKRSGSYESKSGTVTDKITFCKKSLNYINTVDDMSPDAIELTEKILEFIKDQNS